METGNKGPSQPLLPIVRRWELSPEGNPARALEQVLQAITAAHNLGLPWTAETVYDEGFRHGGNMVKAKIVLYQVTVGKGSYSPPEEPSHDD